MRSLILWILFIFLLIGIFSCHRPEGVRSTVCHPLPISKVVLYDSVSHYIADTNADVIIYAGDTIGAPTIDSFQTKPEANAAGEKSIQLMHDVRACRVRIQLYPSGKVYNISNITIYTMSRSFIYPPSGNPFCAYGISYKVNDSTYSSIVSDTIGATNYCSVVTVPY